MKDTVYERVYICVDDTDDLTKTTSTGSIADEIARRVSERFGSRVNMGITRHQLLLDERVPYTSHNSSMCFDLMLPQGSAPEADEIGWKVIRSMRAASANPGLCVLVPQSGKYYDKVVGFGARAKTDYIVLEEAREIGREFPEMLLKSEGDSGQGMIGALAGVGLRITGNDGRFRGKYDLSSVTEGEACTVECFIDGFNDKYGFAPILIDHNGALLESHYIIYPTQDAKAVLRSNRLTFPCVRGESGIWKPYTKDEFNNKRKKRVGCGSFVPDPDKEERFHENKSAYCGSCLYRRLTADGYICIVGKDIQI